MTDPADIEVTLTLKLDELLALSNCANLGAATVVAVWFRKEATIDTASLLRSASITMGTVGQQRFEALLEQMAKVGKGALDANGVPGVNLHRVRPDLTTGA